MENYENNTQGCVDLTMQGIANRFANGRELCGFMVQNLRNIVTDPTNYTKVEELVPGIWCKDEVAMLFAPTNAGKSLFAVQIASKVAREHPEDNVIYFDFELSDKQIANRYVSEEIDLNEQKKSIIANLPGNVYRASIEPYAEDCDYLESIEKIANYCYARYIVVDNITWLSDADTEQSMSASELMKSLCAIKRKYNVSMLVLAHTPKRDKYAPIGLQNLAGSSKIAAFADSAFAINFSTMGANIRYGKQCKWRNGEFTTDDSHVITYEIKKVDGFTKFVEIPEAFSESDHTRLITSDDNGNSDGSIGNNIEEIIREKEARDISYRKLAEELGISYSKLFRAVKKYESKMKEA